MAKGSTHIRLYFPSQPPSPSQLCHHRNYDSSIQLPVPRPDSSEKSPNITSEPPLDFARQTWWDSLLTMHSSFPSLSIPMSERHKRQTRLPVFSSALPIFGFPSSTSLVFYLFISTQKGGLVQPSLLPPIATFFSVFRGRLWQRRSPESDVSPRRTQGALEASLNARWIDEELAQAAWVSRALCSVVYLTVQTLLALFEVCVHPNYTTERCSSGLVLLDNIIRTHSLTFVDMEDPVLHVPPLRSCLRRNLGRLIRHLTLEWTTHTPRARLLLCFPIARTTLGGHEYTPLWLASPAWDSSWSKAELGKETCWRSWWCTLVLTGGHTAYVTSAN